MTSGFDSLKAALADRYQIERQIGRGGMATVYMAEDLSHDRPVAIKVLEPELASGLGADRFVQEIEIAARLTHPRILTLIDSGQADGLLYYVMPYIEGQSLRERLERERQLPIADALQITGEVADALDYAHREGIVHRDIKPGNILLTPGGAVVTDFGIAKALEEAGGARLTQTGVAVGTPAYMSPEQGSGEGHLDGRADQYSLACVLYEMLAGEPPFTGPTAQVVLARQAAAPVMPLSSSRSTVPVPVETALEKALAKVPADRFESVRAFFEAATDHPGAGPLTDQREDLSKHLRRRRLAGLAAILTLAAITLVAVFDRTIGGDADEELASLDPNLVVALPFDIASADPGVIAQRDRVLWMLHQSLPEGSGPHLANLGTVIGLWERAATESGGAPSLGHQLELARTVGAGRLLIGSISGEVDAITLMGSLIDVRDGTEIDTRWIPGTLNRIDRAASALAAELLLSDRPGALPGTRLTQINATAVDEYMEGVFLEIQKDFVAARDAYDAALALDPDFTEAALRRMLAAHHARWLGLEGWSEYDEAADYAWSLRGSLDHKELATITAILGPRGPEDSNPSGRDRVGAAREAVQVAPDVPETWEFLGRWLFQFGALLEIEEWATEAARAFGQYRRLTTVHGARTAFEFLLAENNVENSPRLIDVADYGAALNRTLAEEAGHDPDADPFMERWRALVLDDTASLRVMRARARGGDLVEAELWSSEASFANVPAYQGFPLTDLEIAIAANEQILAERWADSSPGLLAERNHELQSMRLKLAVLQGRPTEAALMYRELVDGPLRSGQWLTRAIEIAIVEPGYDQLADWAAEALRARPDSAIRNGVMRALGPGRGDRICYPELWSVVGHSDTTQTRAVMASLAERHEPPSTENPCRLMLAALLEELEAGTYYPNAAAPELQALEGLMLEAPVVTQSAQANLLLARSHEARGDFAAALRASQRTGNNSDWALPAVAYKELESRYAELVGDTATACAAAAYYSTLRTRPDSVMAGQAEEMQLRMRRLACAAR